MRKRALKRSQDLIVEMGYPEERVHEFDQGRLGTVEVELIATDVALYVSPSAGGDASRFVYAELANLSWVERTGVLTIVRPDRVEVRVEIPAPTGLASFVEGRYAAADE